MRWSQQVAVGVNALSTPVCWWRWFTRARKTRERERENQVGNLIITNISWALQYWFITLEKWLFSQTEAFKYLWSHCQSFVLVRLSQQVLMYLSHVPLLIVSVFYRRTCTYVWKDTWQTCDFPEVKKDRDQPPLCCLSICSLIHVHCHTSALWVESIYGFLWCRHKIPFKLRITMDSVDWSFTQSMA